MTRSPRIMGLARSRASVPEAALAALEGGVAGGRGAALARDVRATLEARVKGTAFPEGIKARVRRALTAVWAFDVAMGLPREGTLRAEIGAYSPGKAMDTLARCLPLRDSHAAGTEERAALDRVVAFLEVAAAIEPVAVPQLKDKSRAGALLESENAAYAAGQALRGTWESLKAALAAEPGIVPAASRGAQGRDGAPRRGGVPVPPPGVIWGRDLRPVVAGLLAGGHGLGAGTVTASVRDGIARVDVVMPREGMNAVVRLAYEPGAREPRRVMATGVPGAYATGDEEAVHAALHDARGDGPAARAASGVARGLDAERPAFAVSVAGGDVRLTTLPGSVDASGFEAALAAAEAVADRHGVGLLLGVAGQVTTVADLLARGYAHAGNRGETLMRREPAPAHGPSPR